MLTSLARLRLTRAANAATRPSHPRIQRLGSFASAAKPGATAATAVAPAGGDAACEPHIVVLGAGVMGLTSALRVQQELPGAKVTVVAHTYGNTLTSAGAAGLWGPYKLANTPEHDVDRWGQATYEHLMQLFHSPDADEAGVMLLPAHWLHGSPQPAPSWSSFLHGWRALTLQELALINTHRTPRGTPQAPGTDPTPPPTAPPTPPPATAAGQAGGGTAGPQPAAALATRAPHACLSPCPDPAPSSRPQLCGSLATQQAAGAPGAHTRNSSSGQHANASTALIAAAQQQQQQQQAPFSPPCEGEGEAASPCLGPIAAVVNCSGLGARSLVADMEMQPIRGQIMRVKAPWITAAYTADDCYIIPNRDTVVLGGTAQVGRWDLEVSQEDHDSIMRRCCRLMPSLASAQVVSDWVGLRPSRTSVRVQLETDELTLHTDATQPQSRIPVVSNYGHGGAGITLAWGCAADVVSLLRKRLQPCNDGQQEGQVAK
ncbi:hypothetical protein V8C86DRAFT_1199542 [Haematococcus lacustris]